VVERAGVRGSRNTEGAGGNQVENRALIAIESMTAEERREQAVEAHICRDRGIGLGGACRAKVEIGVARSAARPPSRSLAGP
jgi:hypothetical protein